MRMILAALAVLVALPAAAQERRPSHCIAMVDGPDQVMPASFRAPVAEDTVRITYVDHAMFLVQTHGGLSAVTDYNGFLGSVKFVPDVVTMNRAHSTHWTALPDPAIPHVLWGWEPEGTANHHLDLGEMLVRNVPTDIRARDGSRTLEADGNSIFIFEVAGLCIGHLGHLHHEPTEADYAAIGRLDVVMAPVDGGLTLDTETMIRVLTRLRSSVVIPMHWFGRTTLERFLSGMEAEFAIERIGASEMTVSLRDLPSRPTVRVLEPRWLSEE
ncbi:MBL fold metallo-hydrolase [Aestuariibius sp. 2305UL40-4]|uniref:MBL fold metallo-hydrolase n=1 Tax=Aestuariibius violaceus TaxID=3234132 RepID=UPI00345EF795